MKKLLLTLCVALFSLTSSAQMWVAGDKAFGVNYSYGFDVETVALGLKGQYYFTDEVRGELAFDYWRKHENVSYWDIQANVHYIFGKLRNRFKVYPLAGIGYMGYKRDDSITSSKKGGNLFLNAGCGAQYYLTRDFFINVEAKCMFKDESQLCLSVGAGFNF